MDLDINKVYHNYIVKMIIFSLFLFKNKRLNPTIYNNSVISFLTKRLSWNINIKIENGEILEKKEIRRKKIISFKNNEPFDYLCIITVTFDTPYNKDTVLKINLNKEEYYNKIINN